MPSDQTQSITKLEAARRQLSTAIELWFHDKDQVSIHTLAFASYEIIHAVSAKRGRKRDLIFDSVLVKTRYRNQYNNFVEKFANFFKHAKHDPDGIIEFPPSTSEMFIMASIFGLDSVGIKANKHELAFTWWLCFHEPRALSKEGRDLIAQSLPVDVVDEIKTLPKNEFLEMFLLM